MSETTAESIVAAHVEALSNLKMGETALIEPLARDAVQAATLLGYRRAAKYQDAKIYRFTSEETPQPESYVAVKYQDDADEYVMWFNVCCWFRMPDMKVFDPPHLWRYLVDPKPATPAQPEGAASASASGQDYSDEEAAAYYQRKCNEISREMSDMTKERDEARKNTETALNQRDEAQEAAANANGECAELHRVLETIRRVADSKP